jgi:tetratricopeptide (TPR) repeat protein
MPTLQDAVNQAFEAFEAGDMSQADWWVRQALQYEPNRADLLNLLGSVCYRTGQIQAAIGWYREALSVDPEQADTYNNLGIALQDLGLWDAALAQFEAAAALRPNDVKTWFNVGNLFGDDGQIPAAIAAYEHALSLNPDYSPARNNLAHLWQVIGEPEKAIQLYRQSITQHPTAGCYMSLGNLLLEQGNTIGAMENYQKSYDLDPQNAALFYNWGLADETMGDSAQAIQHYYSALRWNSRHAESHNQLGVLLQREERGTEALAHLQQAISYRPDFPEAYNNIGQVWQARMELSAAIASFEQAIALDPDLVEAHYNLGQMRLLTGDYARAWSEYAWRWECAAFLKTQLPRHQSIAQWQGEALNGKRILFWAEQTASEALMFVRYAGVLADRGATIVVECEPGLVPIFTQLLQSCKAVEAVIAKGDRAALNALTKFDYQVSFINAASVLQTTIETIPPIFNLENSQTSTERIAITATPEIQELLQAAMPDREFIVIAIDQALDVVAQELANVDLVIAIDHPIAHLAATLGKPTWVMLPFAPQWMWMSDRPDSPWYPTIKLFRQPELGDWGSVVAAILSLIHQPVPSLRDPLD